MKNSNENKFKFVIRCELCNRQYIDSIDCNLVVKPIYKITMHICDTCFSNKVINGKNSNFPELVKIFYSTPYPESKFTPYPESKFRFVDESSND